MRPRERPPSSARNISAPLQQEKQLPLNWFARAQAAAAFIFLAAATWTGVVAANLPSNSGAGDRLAPVPETIRRRPSTPQAVEVNQRHWKNLQQLGAFSELDYLIREFLRIGRNGKIPLRKEAMSSSRARWPQADARAATPRRKP